MKSGTLIVMFIFAMSLGPPAHGQSVPDGYALDQLYRSALNRASFYRLTGLQPPVEIKEPAITVARRKTIQLEELKQMALNHHATLKSYAMENVIADRRVAYDNGTGLTFGIFDGGLRRFRVNESSSRQKQAKLDLHNAKNNILIKVQEVFFNRQTQQEVIASLESQLRYARENYTAGIRLFEHGMANSVDVMDANTLLSTAQWQLAEARYNLQLAVLGVERSVGVFLATIEKRLEE